MYYLMILLACLTLRTTSAGNCTTLKGDNGNCISILSCTELLSELITLNDAHFEYVKKSKCGFEKYPLVCCPTSKNLKAPKATKNIQNLLPSKSYCGYQHTDDYFVPNTRRDPNIDEFPWVGGLLYSGRGYREPEVRCSCTLINNKYCLAAAHCVRNPRIGKPISVQLGDYNLSEDQDCVTTGGLDECNDPVVGYTIDEIIAHPEFSSTPIKHDIALIRLNGSVTYSDYIRPICLPLEGTKLAEIGDTLYTTGWGPGIVEGRTKNLKQRVPTVLLKNEICNRFYSSTGNVHMTNQQTCTSRKGGTDDCQGHPAGPILFSNKNQWHLEAINSVGHGCGGNEPSINTYIPRYIDWILENIRA